jgi:hypothetical protein
MQTYTNTIKGYVAKRYIYLLILLTLIIPNIAMAANLFVRAGATGLGTGNNWTDAYTQLPAALVRGNTYYIAAGNYPSHAVRDSVNGTSLITIKKATMSDYGCTSSCGWNDSYATGQAIFNVPFDIATSYVVFDGVVGSGSNPDSYGFKMLMSCITGATQNQMIGIPPIGYSTLNISNVTISHVAGTNCGSSYDSAQMFIYSNPASANNMTVSYNYMSNSSSNMLIRSWTNSKITHNYFNANWSSSANHGQQISPGAGCNDIELSDNIFNDSYVYVVGTHKTANYRWNVFNNIIIGNGRQASGISSADTFDLDVVSQWQIHHNTFVNMDFGGYGAVFAGNLSDVTANKSYVYNNLYYNSINAGMSNSGYSAGAIVHDYNAYISTTGYNAETHQYLSSSNPFVNVSANNFALISTLPGIVLGPPFDIDYNGIQRSNFDRGAFEYIGSSNLIPSKINTLRFM